MNGIADQQAVGFGFLAMFAEDMYAPIGSLNPPADTRIAKSGWTIVAYLTAQDALFPQKDAANRHISLSKRVFFGFLARNTDDPTVYAAVVRGTDGIVEWVIDAEFLLIPHPRHPGVRVEQGFWNIYQTMSTRRPSERPDHAPERRGRHRPNSRRHRHRHSRGTQPRQRVGDLSCG